MQHVNAVKRMYKKDQNFWQITSSFPLKMSPNLYYCKIFSFDIHFNSNL